MMGNQGQTARPLPPPPQRRAFTLVELLAVISIIMLLATVSLPSIVKLFTAGSESQAFNILAAQILAARAQAIQESTYAAVHIQRSDPNSPSTKPGTYAAVMVLGDNGFRLADGYQPRRIPGMIAFGELSDTFVNFSTDCSYNNMATPAEMDDFTSLTIVFAANGSVVRYVGAGLNNAVVFDTGEDIFIDLTAGFLWNIDVANGSGSGADEFGVPAVVMFEYDRFVQSLHRSAFLQTESRLIPLNLHTGQLFE